MKAVELLLFLLLLVGYVKEKTTPDSLRKKYYPHLPGDDIPKVLQEDFSVSCSDFMYDTSLFTKQNFSRQLREKGPILICVNNSPSYRWTSASHYMVLLATNDKDEFYVSNPKNNVENKKKSNWYKASDILPYVVKAVFC